MSESWEHIRYEQPAARVARIVLARSQAANAQDYQMLGELNQAFDRAARDGEVRVIILAADGNHFSSGHDLRAGTDMSGVDPVGTWCCFDADGAEGYMATEAEMYVGLCWRWRNIPKPTIAQVQGKVIAGGLMLVWPMDLVVCSEDATFADPVVAFGVNGHEYFTHPYEAGARLAKEMLFTGRAITSHEALQHGMVNKVVPRDDLESETLAMAEHIARRPSIGLTLAKQSVNNTLDAMGMYTAIQSAFGLHHVGHNHNLRLYDSLVDPAGLQVIRDEKREPNRALVMDEITFRRVTRDDFGLIASWLAEPHVARWWVHEFTPEAVERDFGPSADGAEPSEDHLVLCDETPIGLIQYSRLADYPEYVAELEPVLPVPDGAVSIDYLIGDPALVGRGVGTAMLRAFVDLIWHVDPRATCVVVPVNTANIASWRALLSAGFRLVARGDLEPDNPIDDRRHEILRIDRPPNT